MDNFATERAGDKEREDKNKGKQTSRTKTVTEKHCSRTDISHELLAENTEELARSTGASEQQEKSGAALTQSHLSVTAHSPSSLKYSS